VIETDGFFTALRAVPIILQSAQALAAAHELGIIHRDIKPSNLMLDSAERVKVTDFGIAHMATESRLTQSGMLLGTPGYTSPEQCLGQPLDARSDIYSLGVTAYEMLTGHTPFNGDTPAALILQIVDGNPQPLAEINPTVPIGVQEIVAKMMHKDPAQRFQMAEDVVEALSAALSEAAPLTMPPRSGRAARASATAARTLARGRPEPEPASARQADAVARATEQLPEVPLASGRPSWLAPLLGAVAALLIVAAVLGFRAIRHDGAEPLTAPGATAAFTPPVEREAIEVDRPAAAAAAVAVPPTDSGADTMPASEPASAETTPQRTSTAAAPSSSSAAGDSPVTAPPPAIPAVTTAAVNVPSAIVPTVTRSADAASAAAAPARPASRAQRAPRSFKTSVDGDPELTLLVGAWVDSALIGAGFELGRGRGAEGFEVLAIAKVVASRDLFYAGRVTTQYTAALTLEASEPATGTQLAGPFSTTAEFTSINLERNLKQATEGLARKLAESLGTRLAADR
jgi:serine/threonine-protein kinase